MAADDGGGLDTENCDARADSPQHPLQRDYFFNRIRKQTNTIGRVQLKQVGTLSGKTFGEKKWTNKKREKKNTQMTKITNRKRAADYILKRRVAIVLLIAARLTVTFSGKSLNASKIEHRLVARVGDVLAVAAAATAVAATINEPTTSAAAPMHFDLLIVARFRRSSLRRGGCSAFFCCNRRISARNENANNHYT